ncbi:MAG TPA: helix-turn-helix transcriptional regulator [Acidimicrobiales bacterium]|nr:helix-turn-helix transcriptional regulator [Acidimicrobiales bacterium]
MAGMTPPAVDRALKNLGENVATWRKLQRLSAEVLASRAGITRATLRKIEQGNGGTVGTENLFRVLRAIGVLDEIDKVTDPYRSDLGKLRADEILPQRVRK